MLNLDLVYMVGTVVLFFIYNTLVLDTSSYLLNGGSKKISVQVTYSLIITLAVAGYIYIGISMAYIYVYLLLLYFLAYKFTSKATIEQSFNGSIIIAMSMSVVLLPLVAVLSIYYGVSYAEVLTNPSILSTSLFHACFMMIIFFVIFRKTLSLEDIKRVTTESIYSPMVAAYGVFGLAFSTSQYALLISDVYLPELIYIVMASLLLNMFLFFFTLLYIINFMRLNSYKSEAMKQQSKYASILNKKREILSNVEKDEQTGFYNRKFVEDMLIEYSTLDKTNFGVISLIAPELKFVNEIFGFDCGDRMILDMAESFEGLTEKRHILARTAASEMAMIVENTDTMEIDIIASRVLNRVKTAANYEVFPMRCEVGYAFYDPKKSKANIKDMILEAKKSVLESEGGMSV